MAHYFWSWGENSWNFLFFLGIIVTLSLSLSARMIQIHALTCVILEVHILLFLKFSVFLTPIFSILQPQIESGDKSKFFKFIPHSVIGFQFFVYYSWDCFNFCCFSYNAPFSLGPPWLVYLIWFFTMHYFIRGWCSFYSSYQDC